MSGLSRQLAPIQLALTVLAIMSSPVFAQAEQLQRNRQGQSDNFPSEISQIVQEWTERCSKKEIVRDSDAHQCWYAAAAALTRYADAAKEPLRKQVEEQQAVWLERSAQVEIDQLSLKQEAPPILVPIPNNLSVSATQSLTSKVPPTPASPTLISAEKSRKIAISSPSSKISKAIKPDASAKVAKKDQRQNKALRVIASKKLGASAAAERLGSSQQMRRQKVVKTLRPTSHAPGDACTNLKCLFGKRQEVE